MSDQLENVVLNFSEESGYEKKAVFLPFPSRAMQSEVPEEVMTGAELKVYSGEHLYYEITMLFIGALAFQALPSPSTVREKVIKNALEELSHCTSVSFSTSFIQNGGIMTKSWLSTSSTARVSGRILVLNFRTA